MPPRLGQFFGHRYFIFLSENQTSLLFPAAERTVMEVKYPAAELRGI